MGRKYKEADFGSARESTLQQLELHPYITRQGGSWQRRPGLGMVTQRLDGHLQAGPQYPLGPGVRGNQRSDVPSALSASGFLQPPRDTALARRDILALTVSKLATVVRDSLRIILVLVRCQVRRPRRPVGPLQFKDNVTQNVQNVLFSYKEKGRGKSKFKKVE